MYGFLLRTRFFFTAGVGTGVETNVVTTATVVVEVAVTDVVDVEMLVVVVAVDSVLVTVERRKFALQNELTTGGTFMVSDVQAGALSERTRLARSAVASMKARPVW